MADLANDQTIVYNAIPTTIGLTKIQLAMTTGVDLILDQMGFGDGGGVTPEPSPDQTALINQLGSVPILGHEDDLEDNVTWYSAIIEAGIADGTIRELGLFDKDGNLCFVGNIPDIVLPSPLEGVAINIPIQLGIKNYYSKYISIKTHIKVTEQIAGSGGYSLFDLVQKDHVLSYEESEGFALQGTFVYKSAVAGERYGYPDFIQKCIEEKNDDRTVTRRIALGSDTLMGYVHPNGHIFYDITEKAKVDRYFEQTGVAWFWGIDEENERVLLPRNNYFFKNASINPGTYNPATLPSLAHSHVLSIDSAGNHSHTITIGSNGNHSHTITISPAGGHTHTEQIAGDHIHTGTIGDTTLNHYHQGGELQVTIKGTGILSTSALTTLVKNGTINKRYVNSKGVVYREYYNNFYSGAIYMDPAVTSLQGIDFDDGGGDGELPTRRNLSFPDINNDSQGNSGGLVRFDSSRYHQTWTGKTSSPVDELEQSINLNHNHSLTINNSGSHTHTINSVADHIHSATNSENGSHVHSATNSENGSHVHSGQANNVEIVSEDMLGDTVTPPSTDLLLYIVVGNVRRRSAMVIDQELEEALHTIDNHVEDKKVELDNYVEHKATIFDDYVQEGVEEISDYTEQIKEEISGYTEEAKDYSIISKEQAEISEYWAGISIAGQIQADWDQTDPDKKSYIRNKPDLDLENTVYLNKSQTLTNKTINADNNIISNIGIDNISSELIVTNITSSSTNTTLATAKAIWDAIHSIVITLDNIDPNLIINSITQSTASNNTLATSLAIWNAIQAIPNYNFVINSITQSTASNNTLATSLAIWNAIQSVNSNTIQLIEDVDQSIRSIPILNQKITTTIDNPVVVSDDSIPTSAAVYKAILNTLDKDVIQGGGIVKVDTRLSTSTNIKTSNPNLTVTSSYTGTQQKTGVLIYKFEYNNGWKLDGVDVDLNNYELSVSGTPLNGNTITLTYTTISTTIIRVDLDNVADLVDYYTITHTPNYVFTRGLSSSNHLSTQTTINSSNPQLTITTNYQPIVEGEEIRGFRYVEDEEDASLTGWYLNNELVNLANYGVSVVGIPQDGDEFSITYNTKNYTYIATDIDYTNGITATENLKTSVQVYCSNNLVTVKSSYTGIQSQEGIINYTFQYEPVSEDRDGWINLDTQEEVDLNDYDLTVYGQVDWDDIIYLTYITTKGKTTVSVDLSTVNDLTTSNFRSGVISTSIRSASVASDSVIPTEKAVRQAINDAGGGGAGGSVTPDSDTTFRNKTIDADDNTISDLTTSNLKSGVLQTSIRAVASASDSSIISEKAIVTALSNTITLTGIQTLTNKTINADNNTVSNLTTSNLKSGVLQTTVRATASASDTAIASEKAIATALSSKVDTSSAQTLTNKTINADNNTVSNLTTSNLKSGVLQTSIRAVASASDTAIASEKAIATALSSIENNMVNLTGNQTISGSKTITNLTTTTQALSTSNTSVATTEFVRKLQTYQAVAYTSPAITLLENVSIYSITPDISQNTTFSFDTSNLLSLSSLFYTFELMFTMPTVVSITFPDNIAWQDGEDPDFSESGTYLLAFRNIGDRWIGNMQGKW